MLLSIIIPCYNAEPWMALCLDSILSQGVDDMEIIAVNDGSKDLTLEILRDYSSRYPAIVKVIDKPNGGVSSARNAGLDIAQGEYIMFVDADDILLPTLDVVVKTVQDDSLKADIVYCGMKIEMRGGGSETDAFKTAINFKPTPDFFASLAPLAIGSPCGKLYRLEIIKCNGIRFNCDMPLYEDAEFNLHYLKYIKTVSTIDAVLYTYLRNDVSATAKFHGEIFLDCIEYIYRQRIDFFVNRLGITEYKTNIERQLTYDLLMSVYSVYRSKNTKNKLRWLKTYWHRGCAINTDWSYRLDSGIPKIIGVLGRKSMLLCHIGLSIIFGVEKVKKRLL